MKFSIFSTILLMGVGLSAAAPSAEPNGDGKDKKHPPGPPDGSYGSVSQSCSASQSSIHCCQANGGQGKSHHVKYKNDEYNLVCSQLFSGENNKPVQAICSTTVACCIGDYCTAIAN
ncbi:MAG: hypothetical protein Q9213_004067 [Squamulea squamosa]